MSQLNAESREFIPSGGLKIESNDNYSEYSSNDSIYSQSFGSPRTDNSFDHTYFDQMQDVERYQHINGSNQSYPPHNQPPTTLSSPVNGSPQFQSDFRKPVPTPEQEQRVNDKYSIPPTSLFHYGNIYLDWKL